MRARIFKPSRAERLPHLDREMLIRYYGIDGDPQTLAEIGRKFHATPERVWVIVRSAAACVGSDDSRIYPA